MSCKLDSSPCESRTCAVTRLQHNRGLAVESLLAILETHFGVCVSLNPFIHAQHSVSLLNDETEVYQLSNWYGELSNLAFL